ncbi:MAG: hypothetical protein R3C59_04380 [Planctomycetaceae bacterium]
MNTYCFEAPGISEVAHYLLLLELNRSTEENGTSLLSMIREDNGTYRVIFESDLPLILLRRHLSEEMLATLKTVPKPKRAKSSGTKRS